MPVAGAGGISPDAPPTATGGPAGQLRNRTRRLPQVA